MLLLLLLPFGGMREDAANVLLFSTGLGEERERERGGG